MNTSLKLMKDASVFIAIMIAAIAMNVGLVVM